MRVPARLVLVLFAACSPPTPPPGPSVAPELGVAVLAPPEEGFFGKGTAWGGVAVKAHASVPDEASGRGSRW
jgi:hypothetical protein